MKRLEAVSLVVVLMTVVVSIEGVRHSMKARRFPLSPMIPVDRLYDSETPGTGNCTEMFFNQRIDHFNFEPSPQFPDLTHYQQRYYICREDQWSPNQPIFFYTGNEANVDLFVNMTGLMWENAAQFGALLIFAEHRYFGKSLPFPGEDMPPVPKVNYLQTDQALADYATLINWLKVSRNSTSSPVIGFGGSYGGMLCSWLRIKYPSALDGCVAGSAPIVNFEDMIPAFNYDTFAQTETLDASAAGGATDFCKANIRQAWTDMENLGQSEEGRALITQQFQMCSPIQTIDDVYALMSYAENSFGNMAMSSYPYPSAYLLLGGKGVLPAYPMRVACNFLNTNLTTAAERLFGLRQAIGVYYNNTKDVMCINVSSTVNHATEVVDYLWGYLSCTTMFMPAGQNGVTDMFYPAAWNTTQQIEACDSQFPGVLTQPGWVQINYGGYGVASWGSNIVFSNGALDPWHGGGILNASAIGVTTVIIPDVGHHIDLMFSNPKDTGAIRAARALEVENIAKWIANKQ